LRARIRGMAQRRASRQTPKLLDAEALWSYALKSLGMRALTVSELREKLRRRAELAPDIDTVLAKLKEYGYLNDERFAENYAAARRDNQGLGQFRVLRDLKQRRVAPKLAEKTAKETFAGLDETELIEQFLARKFRNKNLGEFFKIEKNLASAFRRLQYAGFSSGASIRVLKRYAAQAEELEPLD
jgi:regulatory protein